MTPPSYVFLYAESPAASGRFYADLLDQPPVEAGNDFVLFVLPSGMRIGLWASGGVKPAPTAAGGGTEIGFSVERADAVDAVHEDWAARGIPILFPPTMLPFGRSFVATDPDGHRLRVYALAQA